jgi:hypothetical protein
MTPRLDGFCVIVSSPAPLGYLRSPVIEAETFPETRAERMQRLRLAVNKKRGKCRLRMLFSAKYYDFSKRRKLDCARSVRGTR